MIVREEPRNPENPDNLPPEAHNDEQDPVGEQSQDVASDAMREDSHTASPLESTKAANDDADPAPSSKGDLIDEMRRMEGEGRIDMSAFAGEPNHDDEEGTYGGETTDDEDDDWVSADGEELIETRGSAFDEDDDQEDRDRVLLDIEGEEEE